MSIAATSPVPELSVAAQGGAYLWTVLRVYIAQAWSLFGSPASIAKQIWLPRRTHALLCDWLRALEMLLRRLILLDALTLAPEFAPARAGEAKRRARKLMGAACGACFNADQPESWRAPFALAPRRADASSVSTAPRAPRDDFACAPAGMIGAATAALRLEALARAYNDRERQAQKLANALAEKATAAALVAALADFPRRADRAKPGFAPVSDAALESLRPRADSS
jgi:hypothetical protein